jgi:AMMECR1 domain-containing protein
MLNALISPCSPLLRVIPAVAFLCTISTTSHATSDFNKTEKQALLEYARSCLAAQITGAAPPEPPDCAMRQQRACFVTFFTGKRVFACFGAFTPRRSNLAEEISENVRLALKNDRRSRSATAESAAVAGVQITFPIGLPERVSSYQSIDPTREGMFVEGANGNGVAFVPGEARTASWAFREALRRLGESSAATVAVYRFKADAVSSTKIRYHSLKEFP